MARGVFGGGWPRLGPARSAYLTLFGAVYVSAFVSYWLQYPGAFGADGLAPVKDFWPRIAHGTRDDGPLHLPAYGTLRLPDGVAVAARSFARVPSLLWFREALLPGVDVDTMMEGVALLGTGCGAVA
eukprot:gene4299-23601_t